MQSIIVWAGLIGSIFGAVTSLIALLSLYRGSIRKGYASERDFNHLKTYYQSLAEAFKFQTDTFDKDFMEVRRELDARCDRIDLNQSEIKALLLANLGVKPKPTE